MPSTSPLDFGPYAQILKTLLPRARGIYVYATDGDLLWSADGADLHDLRPAIESLLEDARNGGTASGARHMLEDAPAYCFVLRDALGAVLAVAAIVCRPITREGDLPPFENVERTLSPLLAIARRDIAAQRTRDTGRFNIGETQELEWLIEVTHAQAPASGDALQALLERFAAHAEADLALLYVPGRRVERVATRTELAAGELDMLRGVVSRHLHRVAQLQQKTLIVNKVRDTGGGGLVPFRILCVPLLHRAQAAGVVVAFNRATSRAFESREARMLERLAPRLHEIVDVRFDGTTGLLTRHAFDEQAATLRPRDGGRCLVYADVDELHKINELYGFDAGDAVLGGIAEVFRTQPLPGESLTARVGGDGFVALVDAPSVDSARAFAESVRLAIASLRLPERLAGLSVSASIGVAPLPPGLSLEHGLAGAESACKTAKERGRNRVEAYAPAASLAAEQQRELLLHQELVEAFDKGRLRLYAQPLAPLWDPTRSPRHELFVRMLDARGEMVPADRFRALASRHQLWRRLDEWVLGELLSRLAPCAAALAHSGHVFSMNLSAQSLVEPDFARRIRAAVQAAHVPPGCLCFEIAEDAVVSQLGAIEAFVGEIREFGCQVSIDDFGTGASSLAYLKTLKVSALKIDGTFVRDLLREPRSESLVRAILQIARQLELDTVAENVESAETATHLATLGVTYGQGIALGEPRPLTDVLEAMTRKSAPRLTDAVARPAADKRVH